MKKVVYTLALSSLLYSSEISEYLYRPTPMDLNDATIVINNTEADKEVFPHNGTPNLVLNNYVVRNSQVVKPFSNWVADDWTGLVDASEQWGYADSVSSIVEYGATSLQVKNNETGIFLNTFSHNLVTTHTATSIQYVAGWTGNENLGANLWNTRPNDDLCVVAQLDLHHSFVTDNNSDGVAAVNQALITYIFRINGSDKSFFYNIELHDSRSNWSNTDNIMSIDGQDTDMPIVITYAHTNGVDSIYSKAVPDFGTQLQEFTAGTLPSGTKVYGSCLDRNMMTTIIKNIKSKRNDFNIPQFKIENLRLDTVIIGPEINTNPTRTYYEDGTIKDFGYRENGNMGMNLKELTVYRLSNQSTSPEQQLIISKEEMEDYWFRTHSSVHNPNHLGKYYTFTLLNDSEVTINLSSQSDPYMYLLLGDSKYGSVIAEDDDSGSGTNARIVKILPAGTYTIEATTNNSAADTPLTITLDTKDVIRKPQKPINFSVNSITTNSALLSWVDKSDNEQGFKIYRENTLIATLGANTTSYKVKNLNDDTSYTYKIVAYNSDGNSDISTVSFQTYLEKPSKPNNLTVNNIQITSARLSWTDTSDNESGFKIYRDNVLIATLSSNVTHYNISNLETRTTYHYSVKAFNDAGESNSISISFKTKDDYAWLVPVYHIILN